MNDEELRKVLTEELKNYQLEHPQEGRVIDRFLDFVASGEELQGKGNITRHITCSAWVLSQDRTKVLLTHHKKLSLWLQLGGHVDKGEPWLDAAIREAKEESGITDFTLAKIGIFDLDIHDIPGSHDTPAHQHWDLRYALYADHRVPLLISSESHDLQWVPLVDLEAWTKEESQLRMRSKSWSL